MKNGGPQGFLNRYVCQRAENPVIGNSIRLFCNKHLHPFTASDFEFSTMRHGFTWNATIAGLQHVVGLADADFVKEWTETSRLALIQRDCRARVKQSKCMNDERDRIELARENALPYCKKCKRQCTKYSKAMFSKVSTLIVPL